MIHWTNIAGQLAHSEQFNFKAGELVRKLELYHADFIGTPKRASRGTYWDHKKYCTLIARSVDDMTEEEQEKYESLIDVVFCATTWQEIQRTQTVESFLYLISIGVLPPNVSTEGVEFTTTNGE